MRSYLTEFIGTFYLCLTIGMTVVNGTPMAPLAIGCSLMIMVCMGGHYNPAVSLAAAMRGALPMGQLAPYMVAQLLGAIVAGATTQFLLGASAAPAPGASVGTAAALLNEVLFTFALCLVVLNVATSKKTSGNSYTVWPSASRSWSVLSLVAVSQAGLTTPRSGSGSTWCRGS